MQLYWVLKHGTYLAQRWGEDGGVNLYHCAEVGRGIFAPNPIGHAHTTLKKALCGVQRAF